jgi:hypothetical protein
MRIPTLLQKLSELSAQPERRSAIDVDLMLDYTRVLYADLLEWRSRLPASSAADTRPMAQPTVETEHHESTLADKKQSAPHKAEPVAEPGKMQASAQKVTDAPSVQGDTTLAHTSAVDRSILAEKDIRALIGINDKYQIMSELFGNDREAYEQALDFINHSQSENVAMNWLREQLWITEERSDAAQSFFDIVNRFFRR